MKRRWAWLLVSLALACGERDSSPSVVTVSGTVRKDALGFAGGVRIEVLDSDGAATGHEATSDSAGRFAVEAPARSEVYFRCTATGCVPTNGQIVQTQETPLDGVELWIFSLSGRASAASGVASATGETADLNERGLVVGMVYDEAGYAVTGARVTIDTADDQTGIAYPDFEGAYGELPFTIGLIPTHQFAAVNVPEGEFELAQDVDATTARARSVKGEVTAVILRGLPVYCAVIGAVVDEQQAGVPAATVQALDAAGVLLAETSSDDKGAFVITGLTEGTEFYVHTEAATGYVACNTRYYLIGDEPLLGVGALLVSTTYFDALLAEMEADLGFTHDDTKAVLAAGLADSSGALVVGEAVTMSPESGTAGFVDSSGSFESGGTPYADTQDATGYPQWVAANVEPGTVELGQSLDDTTLKLPCRAGELTYAGFEGLPKLVAITGTVRDETGAGVAGATVLVYDATGPTTISATTAGGLQVGRFQLASNPTDQLRAGTRVSLQVTLAGYSTTNTPYFDLPDSDLAYGKIGIMGTAYYGVLVSEFEAAGGTVDDTNYGVIVGAVRDVQMGVPFGKINPGKVDGATVSGVPVDYVNHDAVANKDTFGHTETDDEVKGNVMFMAANVAEGDVTLTEDWDDTSLECPVRKGEVTVADFKNLTPQNTVWGLVCENNNVSATVEGATVEVYDEDGGLLHTETTDAQGLWNVKERLTEAKTVYVSAYDDRFGKYVGNTNSPYYDLYAADVIVVSPLYDRNCDGQLEAAWENASYGTPDRSSCGVVTGDLMGTVLIIIPVKLDGLTASLRDAGLQVGYLDQNGVFGVAAATVANAKLGGKAAPQFTIFDVPPGDYVLEQSGDGKVMRILVRAGEYTHVGMGDIRVNPVDMSGAVIDSDGNRVAGATVRIPDSPHSTVTAPNGTYTLSGVPARSWITVSVSKDGATINVPYFEANATDALNLFFFPAEGLDLIAMRFEAEFGPLDAENKATVFGSVERAGAPVEGVTVTLSPSPGDTVYFDEYLRAVASQTQNTGLQYMIGNIEPGDAVLSLEGGWQRVELPCRAGEWTLGFVDLQN